MDDLCPHLEGASDGLRLDVEIELGEVRRSTAVEVGRQLGDHIDLICGQHGAALQAKGF